MEGTAGRIHLRPPRRELLLVALAYLALSLYANARAWVHGPLTHMVNPYGDAAQYQWTLGWVAHAITHLQNPWYSTAAFHPLGVNILANPAPFGIALLATPVTLLLGPTGAMNVALTLIPVASGLAMYCAVRRWVELRSAAAVAGALWAFSPFAVYALQAGWLNIASLFILPMLFTVLEDLLVSQRRTWWRNGLGLALLICAQFFISTEACLIDAITIAYASGFIALAMLWKLRRGIVPWLRYVAASAGLAVATTGLVLAFPAWYALRGPSNLGRAVWPDWIFAFSYQPGPSRYLHPYVDGPDFAFFSTLNHWLPNSSLFGAPLLAIALLGGLWYWRRGITVFLLALAGTSLWLVHGYAARPTLWTHVIHLPVVRNIMPERFIAPAWFALSFLLAVTVSCVAGDLRRLPRRGPVLATIATGVLLLAAVLPPLRADFNSLPFRVASAKPSPFLRKHVAELRNHVVLTFPIPNSVALPTTMQAELGFPYTLVGGFGPTYRLYRGRQAEALQVLVKLNQPTGGFYRPTPKDLRTVRWAIRTWGVRDVVATRVPGPRDFTHGGEISQSLALYTQILGPPRYEAGSWYWRVPRELPAITWLTPKAYERCALATMPFGNAVSRCVAEHALPTPP